LKKKIIKAKDALSPLKKHNIMERNIKEFISGYAHLYSYDFLMIFQIIFQP
jgi:hypothetical protein